MYTHYLFVTPTFICVKECGGNVNDNLFLSSFTSFVTGKYCDFLSNVNGAFISSLFTILASALPEKFPALLIISVVIALSPLLFTTFMNTVLLSFA